MGTTHSLPAPGLHHQSALNRWVHLVGGVLAMMALADAQFVAGALARLGEDPTATAVAIRNALGAFVIAETLFVSIERQLLDEVSPVVLTGGGGGLMVASWFLTSRAWGPRELLAWALLGGVGAGLFYAGTVARSLVRFTEHRVRCLLGVAAACAVGAVPAVLLVTGAVRYASVADLLPWNAAQAVVILIAALYVTQPVEWEPPE